MELLPSLSARQAVVTLSDRIALAVSQNAQYPQYDGYFDNDGLAVIVSTKGLRPRGRKMWPVGKIANGRPAFTYPAVYSPTGEAPSDVVLYEPGYGNCQLPAHCVRWIIQPKAGQ